MLKKSKKIIFITLLFAIMSLTLLVFFACNGPRENERYLAIYSEPTRLEFIVGSTIDVSGGYIRIGNQDAISMNSEGVIIEPRILTIQGEQTITVSYQDLSTSFVVMVRPVALSMIVVSLPERTTFIEGEFLNVAGGQVTLNNQGNQTETLNMTDSRLEISYGSLVAGNAVITIRLRANPLIFTTFNITISPLQVLSLSGLVVPTRVNYDVGEELDFTDGLFAVVFNDETQNRVMSMTDSKFDSLFIVSGFIGFPGTHVVRVSAIQDSSVFVYFNVTVNDAEAVSMAITRRPSNINNAIVGYDLDLSGGRISVGFNVSSQSETVYVEADMDNEEWFTIQNFNRNLMTLQSVSVLFNNESNIHTEFELTLRENSIIGMVLNRSPTRTTFYQHEDIDLSGGFIGIQRRSGLLQEVSMTDTSLDNFLTITGRGRALGYVSPISDISSVSLIFRYSLHISTQFAIQVLPNPLVSINIYENPTNMIFNMGDALDLSGGKIELIYSYPANNPIVIRMPMNSVAFSATGFNRFPADYSQTTQNISITHIAEDVEIEIVVDVRKLTDMEVIRPTVFNYRTGQMLNLEGGLVVLTFTHPTLSPSTRTYYMDDPNFLQEFQISAFNSLGATGSQTIDITWRPSLPISVQTIRESFTVYLERVLIESVEFTRLPYNVIMVHTPSSAINNNQVFQLLQGGEVRIRFEDGTYIETPILGAQNNLIGTVFFGNNWRFVNAEDTPVSELRLYINNSLVAEGSVVYTQHHVVILDRNPLSVVQSMTPARAGSPIGLPIGVWNPRYVDATFIAVYHRWLKNFVETFTNPNLFPSPINADLERSDIFYILYHYIYTNSLQDAVDYALAGVNERISPALDVTIQGNEALIEFWNLYLDKAFEFWLNPNFMTAHVTRDEAVEFGQEVWDSFITLSHFNRIEFMYLIGGEFFEFNNARWNLPGGVPSLVQPLLITPATGVNATTALNFNLFSQMMRGFEIALRNKYRALFGVAQGDMIGNAFRSIAISTETETLTLVWFVWGEISHLLGIHHDDAILIIILSRMIFEAHMNVMFYTITRITETNNNDLAEVFVSRFQDHALELLDKWELFFDFFRETPPFSQFFPT